MSRVFFIIKVNIGLHLPRKDLVCNCLPHIKGSRVSFNSQGHPSLDTLLHGREERWSSVTFQMHDLGQFIQLL